MLTTCNINANLLFLGQPLHKSRRLTFLSRALTVLSGMTVWEFWWQTMQWAEFGTLPLFARALAPWAPMLCMCLLIPPATFLSKPPFPLWKEIQVQLAGWFTPKSLCTGSIWTQNASSFTPCTAANTTLQVFCGTLQPQTILYCALSHKTRFFSNILHSYPYFGNSKLKKPHQK